MKSRKYKKAEDLGEQSAGSSLGGMGGGMSNLSVPSIGPMSMTASGAEMPGALASMGAGPMLGKTAAVQFERMTKKAQAQVLLSSDVPTLVKLALAMRHTNLPKKQRIKLAQFLIKRAKAR